MKIEPIEIEQKTCGGIEIDVSGDESIYILNNHHIVLLERENIQKLIDILTAEL